MPRLFILFCFFACLYTIMSSEPETACNETACNETECNETACDEIGLMKAYRESSTDNQGEAFDNYALKYVQQLPYECFRLLNAKGKDDLLFGVSLLQVIPKILPSRRFLVLNFCSALNAWTIQAYDKLTLGEETNKPIK